MAPKAGWTTTATSAPNKMKPIGWRIVTNCRITLSAPLL
jgi:hypothetical protein